MRNFFRFLKSVILIALVVLLGWAAFNMKLVIYGIDQLAGQLRIVMNARPLEEVLCDPATPDSVKAKIRFIESVKQYAYDSLRLKESKNYTTYYDHGSNPLLWVLSASEPFKLKDYEWRFPFLGSVSYKGFFHYDSGKEEELELIATSFDTDYDKVSAWSTLGWFRDPIFSSMMGRSEGQLAELIIHELTHSTIYLKSNVALNENLATVCGEVGADRFLIDRFGAESRERLDYLEKKSDYDRFSKHMLLTAQHLDTLYDAIEDSSVLYKKAAKDRLIRSAIQVMDTISFHSPERFKNMFKSRLPNNAFFLGFIRYDARKEEMKRDLEVKFKGNISDYIEHIKANH